MRRTVGSTEGLFPNQVRVRVLIALISALAGLAAAAVGTHLGG